MKSITWVKSSGELTYLNELDLNCWLIACKCYLESSNVSKLHKNSDLDTNEIPIRMLQITRVLQNSIPTPFLSTVTIDKTIEIIYAELFRQVNLEISTSELRKLEKIGLVQQKEHPADVVSALTFSDCKLRALLSLTINSSLHLNQRLHLKADYIENAVCSFSKNHWKKILAILQNRMIGSGSGCKQFNSSLDGLVLSLFNARCCENHLRKIVSSNSAEKPQCDVYFAKTKAKYQKKIAKMSAAATAQKKRLPNAQSKRWKNNHKNSTALANTITSFETPAARILAHGYRTRTVVQKEAYLKLQQKQLGSSKH
eukprot:Nk52_evm40s1524 gene=Nk52_evmTU40s1524